MTWDSREKCREKGVVMGYRGGGGGWGGEEGWGVEVREGKRREEGQKGVSERKSAGVKGGCGRWEEKG